VGVPKARSNQRWVATPKEDAGATSVAISAR
jgi:hypothetical protein